MFCLPPTNSSSSSASFAYLHKDLLPSEHMLIQEFDCSRNTVRRAIKDLCAGGYAQSIHGKGVRVIYQPGHPAQFTLSGIESFTEASKRNDLNYTTKVVLFSELCVNDEIHTKTGMEKGKEVYYIQRVRILDVVPLIIDHNYFLKEVVTSLSVEIAEESIYRYLEEKLNISIATTKRVITVEPVNETDETNLELNGCNCVAVVSSSTYNDDGIMFEYTQSRHSPKHFEFHEVAQRI